MMEGEKLIELQKKATKHHEVFCHEHDCEDCPYENYAPDCVFASRADYMIANGVIVLPCKIGDDIWWIDSENNTVQCEKNGVAGFIVKKDEILIMDQAGCPARIGTQYCYLTKEEAEKALSEQLTL